MPKLKALAISLASIVVLLAMTACEGLTPARPWPQLTVMTYNVYVGAPPDELLKVMSQAEAPPKVAEFYRNYLASEFPRRAAAIAKIIKRTDPDIIGLQEISLVRKQDPSNAQTAPGPNATDVEQHFLKVLMMKLKDEGLNYKEAGKVETFDLEMPMPTAEGLVDIRLTDHDVILVRGDIAVSDATGAKYKTELPIGNLGLSVPRGYVAVDATVGGVKYRVVNTHLEHFEQKVRDGQTQELIASLKDQKLPVILMGDFNTKAPDGAAYKAITAAGFTDRWQAGSDPGYTCCQADNLRNTMSELGTGDDGGRIDLIFTKGVSLRRSATITTYTVGDKASDKTANGLWPSDHAGVVAHLPIVQ